jgi:hypothetical protein
MNRTTEPPFKPPHGNYQGTELQRTPGIPDGRMRAFDLPSRMGNRLHYPDGRVHPFPGSKPT